MKLWSWCNCSIKLAKCLIYFLGICHYALHLATHQNGDHRSHPNAFQFFSNLHNVKEAPAGASLAPTLVQRVLLVPSPPPITISKAFDLPGSSACAPLPKEQGPVSGTCGKNIFLNSLPLCPFATESCTKMILLGTLHVRMQSRNEVGEHQNPILLPHLSATMYSPVSVCSSCASDAARKWTKLFQKTGVLQSVLFIDDFI